MVDFSPDASPQPSPITFMPDPDVPDMSHVKKTVVNNLTTHDAEEEKEPQTPAQRLDAGFGMPVSSTLTGGDKDAPLPYQVRANLVKSYANGGARSVGDFMQTALHTALPIVSGGDALLSAYNDRADIAKTALSMAEKGAAHLATSTPASLASDVIQGTLAPLAAGATRIAGAAYEASGGELSPEWAERLTNPIPEFGQSSALPLRKGLDEALDYRPKTTSGKATETGLGAIPYIIGGEGSAIRKLTGIAATGIGGTISEESAKELGFGEKGQEVAKILGSTPGMIYGATSPADWAKKKKSGSGSGGDDGSGSGGPPSGGSGGAARGEPSFGIWDNVPGRDTLGNIVAKAVDKPPEAVTSADIDNTIHQSTDNRGPKAQDFEVAAQALGADVQTLHVVYRDTGVTPSKVIDDAHANPAIAEDIRDEKVPEAYSFMAEKPVIPTEKLTVTKSESGKAFNVIDENGDQVHGGFESAEDARHFVEDRKYEAEERLAIEEESKKQPEATTEKTTAGEQTVIPGAEKISDKALAERNMGKFMQSEAVQKPANEGLFDIAGRSQQDLFSAKSKTTIPPSEIGKPTSLRTFLSNNGAKFNEANEIVSIKKDGAKIEGDAALEHANDIAKEHGYLPKDEVNVPARGNAELQNLLTGKDGGRGAFRDADTDRVLKAQEAKAARINVDPVKLEHEANNVGIDTERAKGETEKQYINRLKKALTEFYASQEGSAAMDAYRKTIGAAITAAEKFVGKLSGSLFEKLGEAYIKTFQPELMGDAALRADAYLAKHKTALQEAENSFYRASEKEKAAWDKKSSAERMNWLYDHETGRWNEEENPDHMRYQALLDASFKAEKQSIGADAEKGYKENYLPHLWERPDAVKKFFSSEAMMKKYGADGFTKASEFKLVQDGIRAGFKLKTDNPESMLTARLFAGRIMVETMDLLHDMESSGLAKPARAFSVDKRITKTQAAIEDVQKKYDEAFEKANPPQQGRFENTVHVWSKGMQRAEVRIAQLKLRLDDFTKEKADNKLTPDQMKELKTNGFKIIGPDSKVWNLHQEMGPVWKNAMESKGLWENQGLTGDAYRSYTAGKAIWTATKLGLSLFHPVHVAMIDLASDIAAGAEHLIQGGKFSELATKESLPNIGLTKNTFSNIPEFLRDQSGAPSEKLKPFDHPAVQAWNTPEAERTPEQAQMVKTMVEGGFKPTMSARDTIHFRENFDKAIKGVGINNLRLLGTLVQLPGKAMAPFFEHWIPGMKSEIYLQRAENAVKRDPSLANDAGRRGEVFRQIAKDTDRTYGEMNNEVQFWNKTVRDSFNAAYISGGWKLAQIYNARGLLQLPNIAYKFAKTGEFSKSDITYNMLHAYVYTGLTLTLGAAINKILGNPIAEAKDDIWDIVKNLVFPKTGEKNPDGTPIRLSQPAFAKEAYSIAHDINTKGLIGGTASFLYHETLIPGIVDTLNNQDFFGHKIISNPLDLHQWMNAGWDAIKPISFSNYEKAENKHSSVEKIAGPLGFPLAGAYIDQTKFEQKILATYDEQNPTKGDVYSAKLKGEIKSAIANKDTKAQADIEKEMKAEGMTDSQIAKASKPFTSKFVDVAWKKLSAQDQKKLIESATPEEKKKFTVKSE